MIASIRSALLKPRTTAITAWRAAVAAHVRGKAVDIVALKAAGQELGLPAPAVAGAFDRDVQALVAYEAAVADLAVVAQQMPAVTKAAVAARKRIPELQAELERLVDAASTELPMAGEMASRKRLRDGIEQDNPRLFAASFAGEAEPVAEPVAIEADEDEAVFIV